MKLEDDINYFVRTCMQRLNLPVFVSHCWQSDSKLRFRTELRRRFTISCTKKLKRKYLQRVGFFPFFSHQRLLQTFYDVELARIGIVRSLFSQFSKEYTSILSTEFTANQQITLNHISRKVHRICNFYTCLKMSTVSIEDNEPTFLD